MITLLDGTRLPSHSELYQQWPNLINNILIFLALNNIIDQRVIKKLPELIGINDQQINNDPDTIDSLRSNIKYLINDFTFKPSTYKYEFEKDNWDIIIKIEKLGYYIEYKSNITEWNKSIHEFIRQINRRPFPEGSNVYITKKILLTFDYRFSKYETILKENKIKLFILPQDILNKK